MKIIIQVIPHESQRYNTVGDWWVDEAGDWQIRVSESSNFNDTIAIAVHELVEMALCDAAGITTEEVDQFDFNFDGPGEPGEDPEAPYFDQHHDATAIEMLVVHAFGMKWEDYTRRVEAIGDRE